MYSTTTNLSNDTSFELALPDSVRMALAAHQLAYYYNSLATSVETASLKRKADDDALDAPQTKRARVEVQPQDMTYLFSSPSPSPPSPASTMTTPTKGVIGLGLYMDVYPYPESPVTTPCFYPKLDSNDRIIFGWDELVDDVSVADEGENSPFVEMNPCHELQLLMDLAKVFGPHHTITASSIPVVKVEEQEMEIDWAEQLAVEVAEKGMEVDEDEMEEEEFDDFLLAAFMEYIKVFCASGAHSRSESNLIGSTKARKFSESEKFGVQCASVAPYQTRPLKTAAVATGVAYHAI